jgi:acyl carrier protein
MTEITKQVMHVIAAIKTDRDDLSESTQLNDLALDKYDRLELIMRLEDQFNICIDDEQFTHLNSIQDVAQYVTSLNK